MYISLLGRFGLQPIIVKLKKKIGGGRYLMFDVIVYFKHFTGHENHYYTGMMRVP